MLMSAASELVQDGLFGARLKKVQTCCHLMMEWHRGHQLPLRRYTSRVEVGSVVLKYSGSIAVAGAR